MPCMQGIVRFKEIYLKSCGICCNLAVEHRQCSDIRDDPPGVEGMTWKKHDINKNKIMRDHE